jgi:hypothetical protein
MRVTLKCAKIMFTIEMGLCNYGRFDDARHFTELDLNQYGIK